MEQPSEKRSEGPPSLTGVGSRLPRFILLTFPIYFFTSLFVHTFCLCFTYSFRQSVLRIFLLVDIPSSCYFGFLHAPGHFRKLRHTLFLIVIKLGHTPFLTCPLFPSQVTHLTL